MNRLLSPTDDIFVDTSAYYAIADDSDRNHQAARTILATIGSRRRPLVTTNFIDGETHTLLLTRLRYRYEPRELRRNALQTIERIFVNATVIRVTAEDEARALEIIRRYDDKSFSYFDATSFAVMERLGLVLAFTFDEDFVRYGFTAFAATA